MEPIVLEIIKTGIFYGGYWLVWYLLLRDNFKYPIYVVFFAYLIYVVVDRIMTLNDTTVSLTMAVALLYYNIFQSFLYKRDIVNSYSLDYFITIIGQTLPNVVIVVVTVGAAFISGDSLAWYNKANMTVEMEVLLYSAAIIGYVITYVVCRQLKPTVMRLRGFWKYFIFFFGMFLWRINFMMRILVDPKYQTEPSGPIMYIDLLCMSTCVIVSSVILFGNLLEKRRIKKQILLRMEEEYRTYRRNFALQQELRDLNHEIKNQLIARQGSESYETLDGIEEDGRWKV